MMKINKVYLSEDAKAMLQKRRYYEQKLTDFIIVDQKTFFDKETKLWVQFVKYEIKGE